MAIPLPVGPIQTKLKLVYGLSTFKNYMLLYILVYMHKCIDSKGSC